MSSITVKDIPQALLERIRARAKKDRRSLNKEVIHLVDLALSETHNSEAHKVQTQIEMQTAAWTKLAGQWQSDLTAAAETRAIYAARTPGRTFDW